MTLSTTDLVRALVPALWLLGMVAIPLGAQGSLADTLVPATARSYPINPETAPRPVARAVQTPRPITIDARLDEPEWALAQPMTDFVQQLPQTGQPANQPTVVRLLYDADNIYIGVVCYDTEPWKAITAGLERDFNSGASDIFGVVFDTFLDRRNSFLFLVNPRGAVRDEQTFNDSRNVSEAWEGIIRVKTAMGDSAWYVEMSIPLTTLRFDASKGTQSWGVNFIRRVRRTNETSYWAPLDRQYRLHRMSRAGTVEGFSGLKQGRNLTVKPYALGASSSGAQVLAGSLGSRANAGVDLKYGLTPGLTLDLTTRTDFSQVEVDQEQVNLTRFSLFFPERREFFIENSGSFTFGDVAERNYRMGAELRDFTLFNSRRIGLTSEGTAIPIVGGGRMSGRVGGWEVGMLDMQVERQDDTPAENFAVARVKRNVMGRSDIGLMVLNRQDTEGLGRYNRSYGADANIRLFGNMIVNSYLAASDASESASDGTAGRVSVAYRGPLWNNSVMYKRVSDNFDPGMGFVRRGGMQHTYATAGMHPRPRSRVIQEYNPYVEVDYITNTSSQLETRTLTGGLVVSLQPDGFVDAEFRDQYDRLAGDFLIAPGVTIPAGGYAWREGSLGYQASIGGAFAPNVRLSGGEFYGGTRRSVSAGAVWRPRYDLYVDLSLQRNDVDLPWGAFAADIVGTRLRYALSTALFGSAFVQYNAGTKQLVTNARVNLRYAPLSDIFVVYTERRNMDERVLNERSVALKMTRLFAF